jgi:DNA-binding IclR family transcriptional regulator
MTTSPTLDDDQAMGAPIRSDPIRSDPTRAVGPPSVIEKARRVIEVLGAANKPMGPSALSRGTDLPKSTVARICQELVDWGIVERVGTGFKLGSHVSALATTTSASNRFREIAVPYAVELYAMTGLTTNLSVLNGGDAVLIEKIHGTKDTGSWLHPGLRAPAYSSAAGRAILAFSSMSLISSVVSRPLVRTTPRSLVSPQRLRKELWGVRRRGLAVSRDEVRLGEGALAAPLFDGQRRVIGALAVSTKSSELDSPHLERALIAQAEALSVALR